MIMYLHDDPNINQASGPFFTHEYLTYFSTTPIEQIMKLKPIQVLENPKFNDYIEGPNHVDIYKENAKRIRDLDIQTANDCLIRYSDFSFKPLLDEKIEPWKILILYCTEPDMHLDCDLNLHPSQKLTKGSHGYRHMQFKILGKKFGITDQCLDYYKNASIRAKQQGNEYWAWRFLSRATHYCADLGHPFHVKVAPTAVLIKSLFNLKKYFKIFAAAHNGHEVYTQNRFRMGFIPFKEALINGSLEGFNSKNLFKKELCSYSKNAEKMLTSTYKTIINGYGNEFIDIYNVVHQNKEMDSSKSTILAESQAAKLIFKDPNSEILNTLDTITTKLLFRVGKMIGLLYRDIIPSLVEEKNKE